MVWIDFSAAMLAEARGHHPAIAEIREAVRPYQRAGAVELPMPAVLASAVKR